MIRAALSRLRPAFKGRADSASPSAQGSDLQQQFTWSPPSPPLPLPPDIAEEELRAFVTSVLPTGAPVDEMRAYATNDFRRFVYTLGLADQLEGRALELGANPYFTTMLLRRFTPLELHLANFFADELPDTAAQGVTFRDHVDGSMRTENLEFRHFNIEAAEFPYADEAFDVVFFCEIIEHLIHDPVRVLLEIRRILKPGGHLIVTTPNVARLENVARLIAGANIYDPYSGYGVYGRHNREYNRHELHYLLKFVGFEPENSFTANTLDVDISSYAEPENVRALVAFRQADLGQYLFFRARKAAVPQIGRPTLLYRSYPASELTTWP